jgi:hypothetical protein
MASYAALTTIVHGCRRTHTHHTHARACTPTATRPPAPTTTRGNSRFAALRPSLSTAAVRGRPCRVYTPAMMAATVAGEWQHPNPISHKLQCSELDHSHPEAVL